MPICVVIFKDVQEANELQEILRETSSDPIKIQLIKPSMPKDEFQAELNSDNKKMISSREAIDIENVKILSPKLAKQIRQKTMAFWLMPFGLITGLSFTKMTGLHTFENLGFPSIVEPLIGGFLGMGSGWIGSYFAAGSVNPDLNNDVGYLQKLNKEGLWLLIVETPLEIELPWKEIRGSKNINIMSLNEI